jgi:hypothetical protein
MAWTVLPGRAVVSSTRKGRNPITRYSAVAAQLRWDARGCWRRQAPSRRPYEAAAQNGFTVTSLPTKITDVFKKFLRQL